MKRRILVLGSTGSVGRNVLDVVARHPDRFDVVGLAARRSASLIVEQCGLHPGARFVICDEESHRRVIAEHAELGGRGEEPGERALLDLVDHTEPDLVVNCLVGFVGLAPTLHALKNGISVALANKEAIVTGGALLKREVERSGASIVPMDSEHVAISQCLRGCDIGDVKAVYITASGGALRGRPLESLDSVTREDVLAHPTWDMGEKITVDSATMMNKGLEVIEAHWLFDLPFDKIRIIIHPQSIVHSLVELRDNSLIAQMGLPDMRLPILYALGYPERIDTDMARSDLPQFPDLSFSEVDEARYPCLELALQAGKRGGNAPTVLNSANEAAVGAFLAERISFSQIRETIAAALEGIPSANITSFEDILETHRRTQEYIKGKLGV